MAGRIRDEDIAAVRDRTHIDEVVREYVTLKPAGGGSLKGLCPFHEERSPSFHVTPSRGMYYCFGCGEGGDVLTFLQKVDHLSFAESVEKLAGRAGIELRYVDGGTAINRQAGQRTRLVEAHKAAEAFYREQLSTPGAKEAREFLTSRGFDADVAKHFGVGFAPKGWDALTTHLRQRGFTDAELLAGGLVSQGNRGPYDRFRGRLVWPIRDLGGETIGFGARKLFDDDDGPKYLNTPETPIYKKSQVLYGIDLARRDIAKQQVAVIVEGYTDVMACHLAGVTTAVATCGTSFGAEHIKVLRRLLMDDNEMKGHVVFTFDGDAAGQKAALRAFEEDQRFVSQTFVAVEPSGMDPCDLRLAKGDGAVAALVEARVPLFEFAIRSMLAGFDLDTAEGRSGALTQAAPVVAQIREPVLRSQYVDRLAGLLGMDNDAVRKAVTAAAKTKPSVNPRVAPTSREPGAASTAHMPPPPSRPASSVARAGHSVGPLVERRALKCALQQPDLVADWYATVESSAYTHPKAQAVHAAIAAAGGPSAGVTGLTWIDAVLAACPDDEVRRLVHELAVEPLDVTEGGEARYATSVLARLLALDAERTYSEVFGRLQRAEAIGDAAVVQQLNEELHALQAYQRELQREAFGNT